MAAMMATLGSLLAYVVVVEGGLALLEHMTGDPEGDVERALANLATQNQMEAQSRLAVEQEQQEDVQKKFAKFNQLAPEMLTRASLAGEQAVGMRGGRLIETGLLDSVAAKMGVDSKTLVQKSSPSRMGDYAGLYGALGKNSPGA